MTNRKEQISKAAIDLFAEKGFSATSTSAIAKAADVAEGLIFHYFKNKRGILVDVLNDIYARYIAGLEKLTQDSTQSGLQIIERIIGFHFDFIHKNSKEFLVLTREIPSEIKDADSAGYELIFSSDNKILSVFQFALEKGQQDGSIRETPVYETALIVKGSLVGISKMLRQFSLQSQFQDYSKETVRFIRRGLDPGRTAKKGEC